MCWPFHFFGERRMPSMRLVCDSYALYMYHIFSWNDVIGMCIKTRLWRNALTSSCWTWCLAWFPWWRHQMETFSVLQAIYAGNSPVTGKFPAQRPVTRCFVVFFDLRRNKRLIKQRWGWWFETPSRPLWRHGNVWVTNPARCGRGSILSE